MKILYFDCFSGISGDMTLGALLDLGVDEDALRQQLATLPCADEFILHVEKTAKQGISGTSVTVELTGKAHAGGAEDEKEACGDHSHSRAAAHGHNHGHAPCCAEEEHHPCADHHHGHDHSHSLKQYHEHHHHHRLGYTAISHVITHSGLTQKQKALANQMFYLLAESEASVHDSTVEEVHFHEVGAVDAIVDICGTAIALDLLGVEKICASAINVGGGTVRCAHGILPVPAPATAKLLTGLPIYGDDPSCGELTTPTGAVILKTNAAQYGPIPQMKLLAEGYGFGQRETGRLNALRVLLGEFSDSLPVEKDTDSVLELQANLDDMTPEDLAHCAQILLKAGALDVWTVPAVMKKGRAGHVLCVLAKASDREMLTGLILLHSSTIGVRCVEKGRKVLPRRTLIVDTIYGSIRCKVSLLPNGQERLKPEQDDCAHIAMERGVSLSKIKEAVSRSIR